MTTKSKKPVKPVEKPFLKGNPTDERTVKTALGFFGVLVLTAFMTFMVCTAMSMDNRILRIVLNSMVELLVLFIFYNNAIGRGTEAVARGEILWQRQEKGHPFTEKERAICFHPAKGYVTGLLGTIPILICAIILAVTADRQVTGYGALPSWVSSLQGRNELGDALAAYTVREGMSVVDVIRILVRVGVMPFVSMVGAENRDGMLLLERLSPIIVLLPAIAYGTGYLQGQKERTRIHTGIAENRKSRARKEKRARKARMNRPKGPEQLN